MFYSHRFSGTTDSPLLPPIFAEVGGGIGGFGGGEGVKSPLGFLKEFFRDSDFDSLDPILKGLYEELRGSVMKVSLLLRNFQESAINKQMMGWVVVVEEGSEALRVFALQRDDR